MDYASEFMGDLGYFKEYAQDTLEKERMTFRDLLEIIYRRKRFIAMFFLFVILTITAGTILAPVLYKASSLILVELPERAILPPDNFSSERLEWIETEAQIIKSFPILTQTVQTLKLDSNNRAESIPEKTMEFLIEHFPALGSVLKFNKDRSPAELREKAIRSLEKCVTVSIQKPSNLIRVNAEAGTPQLTADIANTLTKLYIDKHFQLQNSQVHKNYEFIYQQCKSAQEELNAAEQVLQDFLRSENITSLEEELKVYTTKVASLKEEYTNTTLRLNEIKDLLEKANYDFDKLAFVLTEVKNDSYVSGLVSRLATLEAEHTQLLSKYTPAADLVNRVEQEIKEIKNRIRQSTSGIINMTIKLLETRQSSLTSMIRKLKDRLTILSEKSLKLSRLKQDIERKREVNTLLSKKFEEWRLSEAMRANEISNIKSIKILSWAEPPLKPTKPKWNLNLLLALVIGSLGSFGGALFLDYWDDTIKDPRGIKRFLQTESLGGIPYVKRKLLSQEGGTAFREVFKKLWVNLNIHMSKEGVKSFLITSLHSEGKSTTAVHLALTIATTNNKKVVLVDANLRNPSIHTLLDLDNYFGLREVLSNGIKPDAYIRDTKLKNLKVVTSGAVPIEEPLTLLESQKLESFLADLQSEFDVVIVDSPALDKYPDGLILSAKVDGTILLIEAMETRFAVARYTLDMLYKSSNKFLGIILNKRRYFIPEKVYKRL